MKTIITLDKANQAYGFPQLNANGNFNGIIVESGLTANTLTITGLTESLTDTNLLSIDNNGVVNTYPLSGLTGGTSTSGDYLPLSGGTVTGTTYFTDKILVTGTTSEFYGDDPLFGFYSPVIKLDNAAEKPIGFYLTDETITYLAPVGSIGNDAIGLKLKYGANDLDWGLFVYQDKDGIVNGLTANTLTITGLTESLTDTNLLSIDNNGVVNTYPLSGLTGGTSTSGDYLPLSGGTVTGGTIFSNGLTANTLNVTGNTTLSSTTATTIYTNYIDFNTGATATGQVGRLVWNDADEIGGLEVGMAGGAVTLQIGEENLAKVYNADSVTLTSGMVVYVFGSQGNTISVKRASNTGETTSSRALGVVTESIAVGERGFVNTFGLVHDLNTFGYSGGTPIWLGSTPGSWTSTEPTAPQHTVLIGFISRVSASVGSLFVHISNGWELNELHNVDAPNPSNNDVLMYSAGTSVWVNSNKLTLDGLTATTISATTYYGVNAATGGTYSSGTITLAGSGTLSPITGLAQGTVTSVAALTLGTSGTDLGSSVANSGTTPVITLNVPDASATARGVITTNSQTLAGVKTFSSAPNLSSLTASQILALDASSNIQSLATATYPNLTELSYVKGVTSGIQTQFTGKQDSSSNLTSLAGLSYASTAFVKMTGANTFGLDTNTYLTTAVTATTLSAANVLSVTSSNGSPTTTTINAVTGGTYSNGTLTLSGTGNFASTITGFSTSSSFTGGTVSGATNFTGGLTANTISATTYQNLPVSGLTQGTNITLTNNNGNYTIAATGGGLTWNNSTTTQSAAANNGYVGTAATLTTITLPSNPSFGDVIEVVGTGSGLWRISQNANQFIRFGTVSTTTGATGYLSATSQYDCVKLLCTSASTTFVVTSAVGNIFFN